MKKVFFVVMICVMGIVAFVAFKFLKESERRTSPQATASLKTEDLDLSVSYSRPYKNNRAIFGNVVQFGEYWRTGADEATEITFGRDVLFGEVEVEEGTYRLYTIPGEEIWEVILNSELDQWGAFEPDHALDVVKISVVSEELDKRLDQLMIDFESKRNGADLIIAWDDRQVVIPIR